MGKKKINQNINQKIEPRYWFLKHFVVTLDSWSPMMPPEKILKLEREIVSYITIYSDSEVE